MITRYSQLSSSGGYISLKVKKEDAEALYAAVKSLKIKDLLSPEEYHVTVIYDETDPDISLQLDKKLSFDTKSDSLLTLGSGDYEAITLLLTNCPELKEFHNSLLRKGFKHSFFTFTPHISLKYKATREEVEKIKKELPGILKEKGVETITLVSPKQEKLT